MQYAAHSKHNLKQSEILGSTPFFSVAFFCLWTKMIIDIAVYNKRRIFFSLFEHIAFRVEYEFTVCVCNVHTFTFPFFLCAHYNKWGVKNQVNFVWSDFLIAFCVLS